MIAPGEQPPDQAGALAEASFLGGTHDLDREFSSDLIHRELARTDSRCDRGVDGRDLSPGETELDRWTRSYAQHISRRS
jgi:hypothetical protein